MKIAVYAIAKNEEKNARKWAKSCEDADFRIVLDTGSTDATVETLRSCGVEVVPGKVIPWRFDVARNLSLGYVPEEADVCVCIDLDETLSPGWRQVIEKLWRPGVTRMSYPDIRQWNENESRPTQMKYSSKIHSRIGYQWKYAIHETLVVTAGLVEKFVHSEDLFVSQHQDKGKDRGLYLSMLEDLVRTDPSEPRYVFYLGQELIRHKCYERALGELERYLAIENLQCFQERSMAWRLLASCHWRLNRQRDVAANYLLQAAAESPAERENWYNLARSMHDLGDWPNCFAFAFQALNTNDRRQSYVVDPGAWSADLEALFYLSGKNLGLDQRTLKELRAAKPKD